MHSRSVPRNFIVLSLCNPLLVIHATEGDRPVIPAESFGAQCVLVSSPSGPNVVLSRAPLTNLQTWR